MRFKLNDIKNINSNNEIDIILNNFFILMNCFMSEYLISNDLIDSNDELYLSIKDYFIDGDTSTISLYKKLLSVDYLYDITKELPINNFDKEKFSKILNYEFESNDENKSFVF